MTNKKDNNEIIFDYEHVGVEAASTKLVNEVLDEACTIVNTAKESNDPWKYISCLKKYKCQDDAFNHNLTFVINKDCLKNIKLDDSIITSTPQKGQGDEEAKMVSDSSTANSTLLYISQLFDMSELAAEEKNIEEIVKSEVSIIDDVTKMIDHCVAISVCKNWKHEGNNNDYKELLKDNSYQARQSNLSDEVNEVVDTVKSVDGSINNTEATKRQDEPFGAMNKKINEIIYLKDLCSYENAYLTLNRDYEQDFDISNMKLEDPQKLKLQDVDLSPEQDAVQKLGEENLEMPTSSKNVYLHTDSRKRTLVYRCRLQSRKILARLRSWLWRGPMRKYKISRGRPGADRGMRPLSPSSKRRAASLLDHWHGAFSHNSWKFNTISGSFVNSALWKELGSKIQFKRSY